MAMLSSDILPVRKLSLLVNQHQNSKQYTKRIIQMRKLNRVPGWKLYISFTVVSLADKWDVNMILEAQRLYSGTRCSFFVSWRKMTL